MACKIFPVQLDSEWDNGEAFVPTYGLDELLAELFHTIYDRQFIVHKTSNIGTVSKFEQLLCHPINIFSAEKEQKARIRVRIISRLFP